jgi:hypothetical protein
MTLHSVVTHLRISFGLHLHVPTLLLMFMALTLLFAKNTGDAVDPSLSMLA